MSAFSRFTTKLGILFRRARFRQELDEEMSFHREQVEKQFIASGMGAEEARFAAMRQLGNAAALQSETHGLVGFSFESVLQDARFGLRQLRKSPGFAATAILILALGVASCLAIFAFVNAALIKPLPYRDPGRLAILFESIPIGPEFHLSYLDYLDWKRENKVFSSLNVFETSGFMEKTADGLREADGARVSDGFFKTLGVTPALGRDFYYGEDHPEAARTTLLSYSAWQRRYGGDSGVLGKAVVLDEHAYTIIGVLPRNFSFAKAEPADFWAIERPDGGCEKRRGCHNLFGIARLKDGVTFFAALADVKAIAQQLERQYPNTNRDQWGFLRPLPDVFVGSIRPILLTMLCGAGLLLVIASVNVASLLLVRAEARRHEMAIRGALGASPRRLTRQYATEGLLLSIVGTAIGVMVAQASLRTLTKLMPTDMLDSLPFLRDIGLDARVAGFACVLAIFAAALFALIPIARLRVADLRDGLAQGGRAAAGVVWRRFGTKLVVIELATATVLLAGAGLLGKSFYRLLHADIGIVPEHLATVQAAGLGEKYDKDDKKVAAAREIANQLQRLPGVSSVGITSKLPLEDGDGTTEFRIVDRPYHGEHWEVAIRYVSASYMPTMKTQLVSGRYFREDDDSSRPKIVIINDAMARQYFPGENPVGRQIAFGSSETSRMLIVGVVRDLQEGQLDAAPRGAMYLPYNQDPSNYFAVVIRTLQDEQNILPTMASAIHEIDPGMAVFQPLTMRQKIHDGPSTYLHRSAAWIVGGFACMALLLGIVGLYGVIAYSVSQRTREIGVRMALGAERSSVYRLIIAEASRFIAAGVVIGLAGSVGAAMLIRSLLFGVKAWDVSTLLAVALLLASCALLASYIPARRAASINPVEALHAE